MTIEISPPKETKNRMFMHLGAHKTASTFIQFTLRANRDWLEEDGWRFIYFKKEYPKIYKRILKLRKSGVTDPKNETQVKKFFKKISREQNILFSSETLLGPMRIAAPGTIYPHHAKMIHLLRKSTKRAKTQVGFSIRDYESYIHSTYSWLVSQGATYSFEDYLAPIRPEHMSWVPIVANLVEQFGEKRVHIWTFEDFKQHPEAYMIEMLTLAGIQEQGRLKFPHDGAINVSYAPDSLPTAIAWNKDLHQREDIDSKEKERLRKEMRMRLQREAGESPKRPALANESLKAEFAQKYREDMDEIRRRWPSIWVKLKPGNETDVEKASKDA